MKTLSTLIDDVESIVRAAGDEILEVYQEDFEVEHKDDEINSPLTEADKRSHNLIVSRLKKLTPEIPVISEESSDNMAYEKRREFERFWLVDPLDGTKEFVKKNGEFTVNVGLIEEETPLSGVVYVPVTKALYKTAGKEAIAVSNNGTETISVSPVSDPSQATAVCSRSHKDPKIVAVFEQLNIANTQGRGSSLKICQVAEGKAEIYARYGPTWEWDTAAADAVLRAAGGRVTEPDGTPLTYNKKSLKNLNGLVVTNGILHEQVVDAM